MFGNIRKLGCIADGDAHCVAHCPADDTGDVGSGAAACIERHSVLYDHYSNWGSCPAPSCEVCGDEIAVDVDHGADCECPARPLPPVRAYAGPVGVGLDTLAEAYSRKGPL